MASSGNGSVANGTGTARNGLPAIHTHKKHVNGICHDDSVPTVKAKTIDELHSLQKKKSAPTTPVTGSQTPFATLSEQERQKQQLQSIREHCSPSPTTTAGNPLLMHHQLLELCAHPPATRLDENWDNLPSNRSSILATDDNKDKSPL